MFYPKTPNMSDLQVILLEHIMEVIENRSQAMEIDLVPTPVVRLAREHNYKEFMKDFETAPSKGFSVPN